MNPIIVMHKSSKSGKRLRPEDRKLLRKQFADDLAAERRPLRTPVVWLLSLTTLSILLAIAFFA